MRLIFVRHGDTEAKADDRVQSKENPLSETGVQQAKDVAKRLKNYKIDVILSSPFPRAQDTATIINEALQKSLKYDDLLAEVKWPSILEGKKRDNPEVLRYIKMRNEKSATDPDWHYSDEENFMDLKTRANNLLNELAGLKEETVLAVSHSTFMKVVVTVMCHGVNVDYQTFYDFLAFTLPKHTSISTFDLTKVGKWHLVTWNI